MWILFVLFIIICCFITYKVTCYQVLKIEKNNSKFLDLHQDYIVKTLDEIVNIKKDVIQIKKDIYQ